MLCIFLFKKYVCEKLEIKKMHLSIELWINEEERQKSAGKSK